MKTLSLLSAFRFLFNSLVVLLAAGCLALILLAAASFFTSAYRASHYDSKVRENQAAIVIYQTEEAYYSVHHHYSNSLKELHITRGGGKISIMVDAPNKYSAAISGGRDASPLLISHAHAGGPIYLRHLGKKPQALDLFGETLNSIYRAFNG